MFTKSETGGEHRKREVCCTARSKKRNRKAEKGSNQHTVLFEICYQTPLVDSAAAGKYVTVVVVSVVIFSPLGVALVC